MRDQGCILHICASASRRSRAPHNAPCVYIHPCPLSFKIVFLVFPLWKEMELKQDQDQDMEGLKSFISHPAL